MAQRLSDQIEQRIKELILENERYEALIQRNELAAFFNCVPSQINYVIQTRFSRDKGYLVESRRGGGGCIRIYRVSGGEDPRSQLISDIAEQIDREITQHRAEMVVRVLAENDCATARECGLMMAGLTDSALYGVPAERRDAVRSELLRGMLLSLLGYGEP